MSVSIDQAVANAIKAHLSARLSGVEVLPDWPDDQKLEPKTVSVVMSSVRQDLLLQPYEIDRDNVHAVIPDRVYQPKPVDVPTSCSVLNEAKARWNDHLASLDAHLAVDSLNTITSPDAFDLTTGCVLANEFAVDMLAHVPSTVYHSVADSLNTLSSATAQDIPTLIARASEIRQKVNGHFGATIIEWAIRSAELPIQLDIWATSRVELDDLIARVYPLLDMDGTAARLDRGPRTGLLLTLSDGYDGVVDVTFDPPYRMVSESPVGRSEFRATSSGLAYFNVTIKAQTARMAVINLVTTVSTSSTVGQVANTATVKYSSNGPTVTYI